MSNLRFVPNFAAAKEGLKNFGAGLETLSPQLRQRLLDIPDILAKLIRFEVDPCTADAVDVTVSAYPSDFLLMLLAAMRAGNLDIDVVEKICHELSPLGDSITPSVARTGVAGMAAPDPSAAPDTEVAA
jgi:hypothetical protein